MTAHMKHLRIELGVFEFCAASQEEANDRVEVEGNIVMRKLCPSFLEKGGCSFEWLKEKEISVVVPEEIVCSVRNVKSFRIL